MTIVQAYNNKGKFTFKKPSSYLKAAVEPKMNEAVVNEAVVNEAVMNEAVMHASVTDYTMMDESQPLKNDGSQIQVVIYI